MYMYLRVMQNLEDQCYDYTFASLYIFKFTFKNEQTCFNQTRKTN